MWKFVKGVNKPNKDIQCPGCQIVIENKGGMTVHKKFCKLYQKWLDDGGDEQKKPEVHKPGDIRYYNNNNNVNKNDDDDNDKIVIVIGDENKSEEKESSQGRGESKGTRKRYTPSKKLEIVQAFIAEQSKEENKNKNKKEIENIVAARYAVNRSNIDKWYNQRGKRFKKRWTK